MEWLIDSLVGMQGEVIGYLAKNKQFLLDGDIETVNEGITSLGKLAQFLALRKYQQDKTDRESAQWMKERFPDVAPVGSSDESHIL